MKRRVPVLFILIAFIFPWLLASSNFFFVRKSDYSDLVISHLPNAMYLVKTIRSDGAIPLWSDAILSGAPFAADPLSGIWYPPGWLAFFLPQPFGFNLVVLLHLLWGGMGLYYLLLRLGSKRHSSIFGAVAFLLMPKMLAHMAAGNISLVYAVSWTPWLFLAECGRGQELSVPLIKRILAGVILGLIALADPRWTVYAGAGWIAFSIWLAFTNGTIQKPLKILSRWLPGMGLQIVLALGLASALIFPMLEFSGLSTRSSMVAADILNFSLPPTQLIGVFLPDIGGYAEWQVYPGALVSLLCLYALLSRSIRRRSAFWLWLAGVALVISLGSMWPGAEYLAKLPLFDLTRVPSRAWFLTGMSMIVTAAFTIDDLTSASQEVRKTNPFLLLFPIPCLAVLITAGLLLVGQMPPAGFIWGSVAIAVGYAVILVLRKQPNKLGWTAALVILIALDLGGMDWLGIRMRTTTDVFSEGQAAAEFLAAQPGPFRVYSPSYSIPQQTAAAYCLELVDGINPLQLEEYASFMREASGVEVNGYSVTLPAFETANPQVDNALSTPDTRLLGLLNTKYIVSAFDIHLADLVLVWQQEGIRIYENLDVLPRAWLQNVEAVPGEGQVKEIGLTRETPHKLAARVDGAGLAVFSTPDYPGWEVIVDGQVVEKLRVANLLIGIDVKEGQHEVFLQFDPKIIQRSALISCLFWLVVIGCAWVSIRKGRGD